jgi:hypothetical protein
VGRRSEATGDYKRKEGEGRTTRLVAGLRPGLVATGARGYRRLHGRPWGGGLRAGAKGQRCLYCDVRAPAVTGGRMGGSWSARTPDDIARTAGPWRVVLLAQFSGRSQDSRHREADSGLGKARPASGTCAGGVGSRGTGGRRGLARKGVAALLFELTFLQIFV